MPFDIPINQIQYCCIATMVLGENGGKRRENRRLYLIKGHFFESNPPVASSCRTKEQGRLRTFL